jgi:hypothetical protein
VSKETNLATARDQLRRAIDEGDSETAGTDSSLAAAANEMLDVTAEFMGECQKSVPFAEMFMVNDAIAGPLWRCTHRPPHEVPL